MGYTIRASLAGYNALTDTDPRHYSLFADQDNVLIKEFSRGGSDTSSGSEITHSLGYIPFYIVMGKVGSSRWKVANSYDPLGGEWLIYADTSKIYLDEGGSSENDYKYYIFYDNFS